MALTDAKKFIKTIGLDKDLRMALYDVTPDKLTEFLKIKGYNFTLAEFEDAIRTLHLACQTEDAADEIIQIASWFGSIARVEFTNI